MNEDRVDEHIRRDGEYQVDEPVLQPAGVQLAAVVAGDQRSEDRGADECCVMDQSTLPPLRCETSPAAELATMISNDVPMAIGISTPSNSKTVHGFGVIVQLAAGIISVKVAPPPGVCATLMSPRCAWAISRTSARPIP